MSDNAKLAEELEKCNDHRVYRSLCEQFDIQIIAALRGEGQRGSADVGSGKGATSQEAVTASRQSDSHPNAAGQVDTVELEEVRAALGSHKFDSKPLVAYVEGMKAEVARLKEVADSNWKQCVTAAEVEASARKAIQRLADCLALKAPADVVVTAAIDNLTRIIDEKRTAESENAALLALLEEIKGRVQFGVSMHMSSDIVKMCDAALKEGK